jgi:hypothetical protein
MKTLAIYPGSFNPFHIGHLNIQKNDRRNYRDSKIKDSDKTIYAHCNVDSLKYFINNGYSIEKALFKWLKIKERL